VGGELRREPILEAMIRVAGRKGYRATSVADVVAEARASRATFYKYFGDKRDCFLAALELAIERLLDVVRSSCDPGGPWQERARGGLDAIVDCFARDPALARIVVVEAGAAGDEARHRYWTTIGKLARMLEEAQGARLESRLPPSTAAMAVSGVAGLIFEELQAERVDGLADLLPELEFALLVPFLGPRAALQETRLTMQPPRTPTDKPPHKTAL
jgi:AcrR family transcriptional regulator